MPTVTETPVKGYAHCRNARCPGYQQQEVDAVREEKSFTFGDGGGDGVFTHMVERSMVAFLFADPGEASCPSCGEAREVTGDPRPSYQPLSGHDPMFLATSGAKFDPSMVVPPGEDKTAELEAKLALMQEQMAALLKAQEKE